MQAAERAARAAVLAALQWSEDEEEALRRAEALRALGLPARAALVVARGVVLPATFRHGDVVAASRLDIARWYAALMGMEWDGTSVSFTRARSLSGRLRRDGLRNPDVVAPDTPASYPFRHAHLLVEPTTRTTAWRATMDFTDAVGWPDPFHCGHLQWDDPDGLQCCYCAALLLPSEAEAVRNAPTLVRGKYCCAEGYGVTASIIVTLA